MNLNSEHGNKSIAGLVVFIVLVILCLSVFVDNGSSEVIYDKNSLYHHIRVVETGGYRYLYFNKMRGRQSAVNLFNHYELKFAYTQAGFVALAMLDKPPEKALFVGLGGGSMPRVMAKHYPDVAIDVVEIDPDVVEVAKKYFFFEPTPQMKVFVQDARRFLRRHSKKYDYIFLDAYNDASIPFHLTTKEFFQIVKEHLEPGGWVAANVWGPRNDQFYLAEAKTYQSVFNSLYVLDAVGTNNYIMMASDVGSDITKETFIERSRHLKAKRKFPFEVLPYARTMQDLSEKDIHADILTDDYAPVEILRARKAVEN